MLGRTRLETLAKRKKNEGFQLAATETLLKLAVRFELPRFGDLQPLGVSSGNARFTLKKKPACLIHYNS